MTFYIFSCTSQWTSYAKKASFCTLKKLKIEKNGFFLTSKAHVVPVPLRISCFPSVRFSQSNVFLHNKINVHQSYNYSNNAYYWIWIHSFCFIACYIQQQVIINVECNDLFCSGIQFIQMRVLYIMIVIHLRYPVRIKLLWL